VVQGCEKTGAVVLFHGPPSTPGPASSESLHGDDVTSRSPSALLQSFATSTPTKERQTATKQRMYRRLVTVRSAVPEEHRRYDEEMLSKSVQSARDGPVWSHRHTIRVVSSGPGTGIPKRRTSETMNKSNIACARRLKMNYSPERLARVALK
jgi:hypothetical protein